MFRYALTFLLALSATPSLACQCMPVETEEARREVARRLAASPLIGLFETVEEMSPEKGRGELVRAVHILAGNGEGGGLYRIERDFIPSAPPSPGICAFVFMKGQTSVAALSPAAEGKRETGTYNVNGMCDALFLRSEDNVRLVLEERRKRERQ